MNSPNQNVNDKPETAPSPDANPCLPAHHARAGSSSYIRQLSGLTASKERRLLMAIAKRLPPFVTPNHLTLLGLAGGAMTGIGYALSGLNRATLALAIFGFFLHWFGDSLDGTLARVRRIERPRFGMFIDQSADLLAVLMLIGGMGLSPWLRFDVALIAYSAYLLLAVLVHLRASVLGIYDVAHDGVGPTEGRILLVIMTLSIAIYPPSQQVSWFGGMNQIDLIMTGVAIWAIITYAREAWRIGHILAAAEPSRYG